MNIINIIYRSPTVVKDDNLDRSPFYPYPFQAICIEKKLNENLTHNMVYTGICTNIRSRK